MKTLFILLLLAGFAVLQGTADELRDPFWPVGYQSAEEAPENEKEETPLNFDNLTPKEQALIRAHMNVSGILKQGGSFFAFINGQVVKKGDVVPLSVGETKYRFRINDISDNTINLEPVRDNTVNEKPKPTTGEK